MNHKRNQEKSQTKKKQYRPAIFDQLFQSIKKKRINSDNNAEEYANKLNAGFSKSNAETITINYIVSQCLYHNNNFYESEKTIALRLGVSARTVSRAVKKIRMLDVVYRRRRFNNSNIYKINPALRKPEIIEMLAAVLPALRGLLCLSILIPITVLCKPYPTRAYQENGQLYYKNEYLINSSSCSLSKDIVRRGGTKTGITSLGEVLGSMLGTKPRKMQMSEYEEQKNLKREYRQPENNQKTYGGTGIYDRKTSQTEIDLLSKIRERQKRKYSMDSIEVDNEAQPRFNEMPAERKYKYHENTMYSPYQHKEYILENPEEASQKLLAWTKSVEFEKFCALYGREEALKMCRNIVNNALENSK